MARAGHGVDRATHQSRAGRGWTRRVRVVLACAGVIVLLTACDDSPEAPSATATASPPPAADATPPTQPSTPAETPAPSVAPPVETAATRPLETSPPTPDTVPSTDAPTTEAPTTTSTAGGPLEIVDGRFLGIAQGSPVTDAAQAFGVAPVPLHDTEFSPPVTACTGTPDPLVIRAGGLTLVFEAADAETPFLTNWTYLGGPVAGFTEMVAPNGIRVGDSRERLVAAFPDHVDYGSEITVSDPYLEFTVDGGAVTGFGVIECIFEAVED